MPENASVCGRDIILRSIRCRNRRIRPKPLTGKTLPDSIVSSPSSSLDHVRQRVRVRPGKHGKNEFERDFACAYAFASQCDIGRSVGFAIGFDMRLRFSLHQYLAIRLHNGLHFPLSCRLSR